MFAQPRPKKTLVAPPKKRKATHTVEEIAFDNDARADYLTGFHKRKQARIKHAQEVAAEKARQERIELRKQIREDRKKGVEEHVDQVNAMLRVAQNAGREGGDSSEDEDGWGGFADAPEAAPEVVDLEAEYIDEDKYTTVTIESVNVDRDGLHKPEAESEADPDEDGEDCSDDGTTGGSRRGDKADGKETQKPRPKKPKKKKFRYESKTERRITERKSRTRR